MCKPPQDWLEMMGMEKDWEEAASDMRCIQTCDEEGNPI